MELTGPLSWKTCRSRTPGPVDCRTGFENPDHSFWQPTVKKWIRYYIFKVNIFTAYIGAIHSSKVNISHNCWIMSALGHTAYPDQSTIIK